MDRPRVKALIVAGNIFGVIAIITIIILHNNTATSVEETESRTDRPHNNKVTYLHEKSEMDVRFEKDDEDENEETQESDEEDMEEQSEDPEEDVVAESTEESDETEQTAYADYESEQKKSSSSQSDTETSSSSGTTGGTPGKSTDTDTNQTTESDSQSSSNSGDTEEKKEVNEEPEEPTFLQEVRSRLPSGYSAGGSNESVSIIREKDGKSIATINGGNITFNTKSQDDWAVGDRLTPILHKQ
ncbi:hypothetical protein [Lentibacillus salinarum]|uniref:Uncharacterized protein n=1 Tax=Lentibacillus salinarum TaxID=446820 RepID=A0ABW4A0L8_9BACI